MLSNRVLRSGKRLFLAAHPAEDQMTPVDPHCAGKIRLENQFLPWEICRKTIKMTGRPSTRAKTHKIHLFEE